MATTSAGVSELFKGSKPRRLKENEMAKMRGGKKKKKKGSRRG